MWTCLTAIALKGEGRTSKSSKTNTTLPWTPRRAILSFFSRLRFRNPKRFMAIPAPLPCVRWWRVCLDEAQMIEASSGGITKTAEMALRLSAVNRWCATGTPIEKSLNDVQGLLMFLKVDPYSIPHWWRECLYEPYCRGKKQPLEEVLRNLLWRTAKRDVLDQINIPSQTEDIHWLSFSPIEEHFYRYTRFKKKLSYVMAIH